ncbi:MAG TPA: SDR family oxidoreductase [Pirellulales bacterium]|nr:SDR family oxidoreductase [Pirellulales bacterium]
MSQNAKVAIVTGASQGIGARLVEAYLGRGYRVVANSRSIQPGNAQSPNVLGVPGDISEPETAKRVVRAAVERFGGVDTLVNNAGIFVAKPFVDYTAEDYNRVLTVNLQGFFYVTQQAVREMLKRGSGHIVQITTTLADQPIKGVDAALAALTKGGLNAVTRSLAIEYADKGIRVNAVAPGIVKTPMHAPETHEFLAGLHPLKRMGEVQEIVDAVLYLESAGFVTGEVLHVDGGQHAGKW